jgi:hypothetical protein
MVALLVLSALLLVGGASAQLPSCEDDTATHCLGEDADMSPEGIDKCLASLGADVLSASCASYVRVLEGCDADISGSGICATAHQNGETMPCLIQRVKPEQLSASCAAALPKRELSDSLQDTFWAEGKRVLTEAEMAKLQGEDAETYDRWYRRKTGKKTAKDKDRAYAVKQQKKQQATSSVTAQAEAAASAAIAAGGDATEAATKAAEAAAQREIESDLTGTLKSFSKAEMKEIVKAAVSKASGKPKSEL